MSTTPASSGPPPPGFPSPFGTGPTIAAFETVVSIGTAEKQINDAWHNLSYTIKRRVPLQINRVRIYGSQLAGAVRYTPRG